MFRDGEVPRRSPFVRVPSVVRMVLPDDSLPARRLTTLHYKIDSHTNTFTFPPDGDLTAVDFKATH